MNQIRAQTTSKNGEISCSVEETNRIRAALGLKPLRVTKPKSPPPEPPKPDQSSSQQIRERIQASRTARRHRTSTIAPRSIAEQALYDDDEEDLNAWVERSRIRTAPRTPLIDEQVPQSKELIVGQESQAVGNVAEEVNLSGGQTRTLTLRDVDVVNTRDDILEDHDIATASLRKRIQEQINGMVYDGTDTFQFEKMPQKDGVQSATEQPRVVENDYESEAVFRKVKKRSKKRRRREPHAVVPGSVDALKKAADAHIAQESDDDEHYELLRKATAKAAERNVEGTVSRILKAVERAERGGDAEMEDGARLVGEEMAQFLGADIMDKSDSEDDDQRGEPETKEGASGEGGFDEEEEEAKQDVDMKQKISDTPKTEGKEHTEGTIRPPAEKIPETGLETNGMTGVAATLARLRTMGELKHKPPQKGRAKDKRFEDDGGPSGKKEIKLSYLDEFGNQLTPKEAFRVLCHSFHGKGPGQNKREQRLRKMLDAAKKRSMQDDDTPLESAAALKAETRRLGSAHVVLSGAQALQVPLNAGNGLTNGEANAFKQ